MAVHANGLSRRGQLAETKKGSSVSRWVGDLACGSHRPPYLWGSATRPPDRLAGTPAATV